MERSDNHGLTLAVLLNPEKGLTVGERLQRFELFLICLPKVVAALQPWAAISERLRRFYSYPHIRPVRLKISTVRVFVVVLQAFPAYDAAPKNYPKEKHYETTNSLDCLLPAVLCKLYLCTSSSTFSVH